MAQNAGNCESSCGKRISRWKGMYPGWAWLTTCMPDKSCTCRWNNKRSTGHWMGQLLMLNIARQLQSLWLIMTHLVLPNIINHFSIECLLISWEKKTHKCLLILQIKSSLWHQEINSMIHVIEFVDSNWLWTWWNKNKKKSQNEGNRNSPCVVV